MTMMFSYLLITPTICLLYNFPKLFLRQLLELLRDEGYIYPNFNPPRWAWDLNKIEILEISDNVVLLLIKEMQRLQPNLQLALKVAAGIGCTVQYSIFDILSQDLGVNLRDLLSQVVQKGYMVHVDDLIPLLI